MLLVGVLSNLSQYMRNADRFVSERLFAIMNALHPVVRHDPKCPATRSLVDVIAIVTNVVANGPKDNALLVHHVSLDAERLFAFLRRLVETIDGTTNAQLAAHITEEDLEFTALVVGVLRCLEKLVRYLEQHGWRREGGTTVSLGALESLLETFPVPSIRRDSRGEPFRVGLRVRHDGSDRRRWSAFAGPQGWSIVYSSIPWGRLLE